MKKFVPIALLLALTVLFSTGCPRRVPLLTSTIAPIADTK